MSTDTKYLLDYSPQGYLLWKDGKLLTVISVEKKMDTTQILCELVEVLTGEQCNDIVHIMDRK